MGKSVAEIEKEWHALARKGKAADLDRLLAAPWPGRWQEALPRAEALGKRKPDARITASLIKLLEEMPWTSRGSIALWRVVVETLVASKSGEARACLDGLVARGTTFYDADTMKALLTRAIGDLHAAHVGPAKRRAAPAEPLPVTSEALAVHADALLEKGDPRGEFISLQCAPPTRASLARQKALLKQHEKTWLGGLAAAVKKGSTVWERGVLVACELDPRKNGAVKVAIGQPALATVRRLGVPDAPPEDTAALLAHPVLANLRALDPWFPFGQYVPKVIERVGAAMPPVEEIVGSYWDDRLGLLAATFPKLRVLGAVSRWREGPDPELVASPLWKRLEAIVTMDSREVIAGFVRALRERPSPKLRTLRLRAYGSDDELVFDLETGVAEVARPNFHQSIDGAKGVLTTVRTRASDDHFAKIVKGAGAKLEIVS